MTTQDYKILAPVFAGEIASRSDEARETVRAIVLSMADALLRDNERFKREAFYVACGLTPGGYLP